MGTNIHIEKIAKSRRPEVDFNNIPFGKVFSDHFFTADYVDGEWTNLSIRPFEKLSIHPANMTLHYGQSIFEGMKIFKDVNGIPTLYRPEMHIERLNKSARRMAMAELPEEIFMEALTKLIELDADWIPDSPDSSLYIRPFMFAFDEFIGVKPSDKYKFIIFTCPVGMYYSEPVKLMTMPEYVRAAKGGVGNAKTAGNYAASLYPAMKAKEAGFDQILWLDGIEQSFVQEVGTMNMFFVIDNVVITPPLEDGTILAGITRDSFIHILKDKGYTVEERNIRIEEVIEASKKGTLQEAFGSGTAAVVALIDCIKHGDELVKFEAPKEGDISLMLKNELNGIRKGTIEDKFGWTSKINVPVML